MKKSLFRLADVFELYLAYIFCLSLNVLLDYARTLDFDSDILKAFLKSFIDFQPLIALLFTSIVIVCHYQMLHRKNIEIFCRILVGGTAFHITTRYVLDCIAILIFSCFPLAFASVYLNVSLTSNVCLILIFVIYILIGARRVWKKYENL